MQLQLQKKSRLTSGHILVSEFQRTDTYANQQTFSLYSWRVKQARQCCSEDEECNDNQKQTVDEAGQDLHTIIAACQTLSIHNTCTCVTLKSFTVY